MYDACMTDELNAVDPDAEGGKGGARPKPSRSNVAGRMMFNMPQKTIDAMAVAMAVTGDGKTDVVNRAIQLYGYILSVHQKGGGLYIRTRERGELERLTFVL